MFALVKVKVGEELVPLTHITSYKVREIDVDGDGAGTSEDGTTIRDVRRRNKSKITLKLEGLTLEEYTKVKTAIDAAKFEVTFFAGTWRTIAAYAGDRDSELTKAKGELESRWRLDFSIIEY